MATAATREGTAAFRDRQVAAQADPAHFRELDGRQVSSIGLGTYLGPASAEADEGYARAVVRAVELGTNLIDSAINYRCQRSERSVGEALRRILERGLARREELVFSTKGGFIPFDGEPIRGASAMQAWVEARVVKAGLARPEEIAAGCHCMTPAYLRAELEQSRRNLGLDCIDLYYVHNPETQLDEIGRPEFNRRLAAAFEELERAVVAGSIRSYGVATWSGLRVDSSEPGHLDLEEIVSLARKAGGAHNHFRAVQLPINLSMTEALIAANQTRAGRKVTLLEAAAALGVAIVASGSMAQARLARGLPKGMQTLLPGLDSDAQRAIQFTRSIPGVTSALVGMGRPEHVEENLRLARLPPAAADTVTALARSPGGRLE